jgi:hypothetical protein
MVFAFPYWPEMISRALASKGAGGHEATVKYATTSVLTVADPLPSSDKSARGESHFFRRPKCSMKLTLAKAANCVCNDRRYTVKISKEPWFQAFQQSRGNACMDRRHLFLALFG